MNCPVCDTELKTNLCPVCGFDSTSAAELYPTFFFAVTGDSIARRRREWKNVRIPEPSVAQPFTWKLDDDGCFTVFGDGELPSWFSSSITDLRKEIKTFRFEGHITGIGEWAFEECSKLTGITIPEGVTSIGANAFYNCASLRNVFLPKSVVHIGEAAFFNCSALTSITIPDSVYSIDGWTFKGCNSLTSVTIPASVIHISSTAFLDCDHLKDIYYEGSELSWNISGFSIIFTLIREKPIIHFGMNSENDKQSKKS